MKRIVTYLYEYHNGKKGGNTGFLKLDQRGRDCRMELCVRSQGKNAERGNVYLITHGEEQGVFMGEITLTRGNGELSVRFTAEHIQESPYELSGMEGVGIRFDSGRYMASSWVEEPGLQLQTGEFTEWTRPGVPKKQEAGRAENITDFRKRSGVTKQPDANIRVIKEEVKKESENGIPAEKKQAAAEKEIPREDGRTAVEKVMPRQENRNTAEKVIPREEDGITPEKSDEISVQSIAAEPAVKPLRRIDISDIHKLPKKNWYLCNNSFLIHGFFNYHYLVLREVEQDGVKKTYLGVPGIYERPERAMALLFGFPEFESEENCRRTAKKEGARPRAAEISGGRDPMTGAKPAVPERAETPEAPEAPVGTFGYWFCLLDM